MKRQTRHTCVYRKPEPSCTALTQRELCKVNMWELVEGEGQIVVRDAMECEEGMAAAVPDEGM